MGHWCVIPPGYAHILEGQIPEIKKLTRSLLVRNLMFQSGDTTNLSIDKSISVENTFAVDSAFFEIFDHEFLYGSKETVLRDPLTIVLTESTALRLFGRTDVLHQMVRINNTINMRIDGVVKDPVNTHFVAKAFYSVVSNETFLWEGSTTDLGSSNYLTYFLFNKGFNVDEIRTKLFNFIASYQNGRLLDEGDTEEFIVLRPLKDIYFFKEAQYEGGVIHGNKPVVNAFIVIAIFILMIASINFINLSTARAMLRAKEVVGSFRSHLIMQFLIESTIICFISMLLALTLLQIAIPEFNNLALTTLSFSILLKPISILTLILVCILIGIISGLYPALYLSYYNPIKVLKGEVNSGKKAGSFRKVLISFQFIIAAVLISGTFVVNQQINHLKNKDLGFKKEHIINFRLRDGFYTNREDFKTKLLQNPNILKVSFSHGIPGNTRNTNTFIWKDEYIQTRVSSVDADFFDLYKIEVLDGNVDMWKLDSEQRNYAVINETLAKMIGWEDPVGQTVNRDGNYSSFMHPSFTVAAVIKDYHLESLHTPVPPLALCRDDNSHWQTSIKISGNNIKETLDHIEKTWNSYNSGFPFKFTFLDQDFDKMYKSEERMQSIAMFFSLLAIFIACLGLFGLSAFMTQRRFKEIGIRKVLGASTNQIVHQLSKEFAILILISNLISIPLSYYALNNWLDDYPYRIDIAWWVFPLALTATLFVALITVV